MNEVFPSEVKEIDAPAQSMQAAVIVAPSKTEMRELPLPVPTEGQIRIKIEGCGVCASNIPIWEGRDWFSYPVPAGNPGHEGWGTVDAVGPNVPDLKIGDRVACLSYNAYAEYDLANADECVLLPEFLDDKPFPGEPLGCAMNIFERSNIKSGHTVAIVGAGFLGLLLIQLCKSAGARVIAISKRDSSLEWANRAGADYLIPMNDHYEIIENVKSITNGIFCDRVIEATGKEWPLNLSIELTKERGRLIIAGFHQDGMRNLNVQMLNWRGIDMISAHERDPQRYVGGMRSAIDAIRNNQMNPFPFFTHHFHLSDLQSALDHVKDRPDGFIKAIISNEPHNRR